MNMQVSYRDPDTLQHVEEIKAGNKKSAEIIYHQYGKAMYNTLIRMTNDTTEAEDLLQEAFIRAFRSIHQFQGNSTFGAWLKRIVVNTALESLRKKTIWFDPIHADESYDQIQEESEPHNWSDILANVELVQQCIQELPTGSRNIVTLYLLEGYSHEEIGEIMGISPSTSKTQYKRGKSLLKQKISERYERRSI